MKSPTCLKMAQQSGVAKVRKTPETMVATGTEIQGYLRSTPRRSRSFSAREMES